MENVAAVKKLSAFALLAFLASMAVPASAQQVEYFHLDAIGSVRAVTGTGGAILVRHDYEPYGREWNAPSSSDTRRFTGKERDSESGMDYFGARYFSAPIARFTSVDPAYTWGENLVDPERWNRYAYTRNNPLKYLDPDGRVIDTIADIGFIGWDVFDIGRSVYRGEEISGTQWLALGGDVVGAALPFATGIGAAIKGGSKVEHALEVGRATEYVVEVERAEARGGTYVLRDAEGQVARTGRTNDLGRRAGEHGRDPTTADLKFEVDRRTDVYAEQRGREQVIHDTHQPPLNKVNPISPTNPRRQEYLDAAKRLENP